MSATGTVPSQFRYFATLDGLASFSRESIVGFYAQVIFPRLLDWSLSAPPFPLYRQQVLREVEGNVLEIGFGTGLNLPHYPASVRKLVAIDPNPGMKALAMPRVEASALDVDFRRLNGESLPLESETFDSVVSTWTLCSIAQVDRALQEIHRVLKPGGKFFFIEHGKSPDPKVANWQNRLTPLQKIIGDGCHLNRDIASLVTASGLNVVNLERFYLEDTPKILGYLYQGVAEKLRSDSV